MVMMKTSTNNNKKTTSKLKTCKLQLNLISKNNLVRKLITLIKIQVLNLRFILKVKQKLISEPKIATLKVNR
jgi:hypothetical protein